MMAWERVNRGKTWSLEYNRLSWMNKVWMGNTGILIVLQKNSPAHFIFSLGSPFGSCATVLESRRAIKFNPAHFFAPMQRLAAGSCPLSSVQWRVGHSSSIWGHALLNAVQYILCSMTLCHVHISIQCSAKCAVQCELPVATQCWMSLVHCAQLKIYPVRIVQLRKRPMWVVICNIRCAQFAVECKSSAI